MSKKQVIAVITLTLFLGTIIFARGIVNMWNEGTFFSLWLPWLGAAIMVCLLVTLFLLQSKTKK